MVPCSPISCLAPLLLLTSNIVFLKCCGFWPPHCVILATGLNTNPENLCYEQKTYECAYLIWNDIEYWFNYSSSSKFSSAAQTLNIWKTFLLLKTFFTTLVLQASLPVVQKTNLLKYPQAWNSQNKFKKITANQNWLSSQLTSPKTAILGR